MPAGKLINCVVYRDGEKLADVEPDAVPGYLDQPGCLVWVGMHDATPGDLEVMRQQFGLHPLAVEDARSGGQRPKVEEYGDALFAVAHTVEPDAEGLRVGEVGIFVGANYVLSVRQRSQRGFQDVRQRCEREHELLRYGSGFVLYALLDTLVDRYFPVLEDLQDELERIEENIFKGNEPRANLESLYDLKRRLMVLHHAAAPLLEASARLWGGRVPRLCTGMGEYFRDVYDHLVRLNGMVDTTREMVTTAISVNLSMIAINDNTVTKRLAAYGALVAVPTMLAGIYGMNFTHMPELQHPWGYPAALLLMVGIDGYVFYRLRRAGWL
jgi:magnesium transporter